MSGGPTWKTYLFTYFGLLGLLLINTLIAFVNLGGWGTVIEIGLATIMACLVAGILMHGFYEAKIIQIIIAGGVIWFLIMMSLTLNDYFTRGWLPFHWP
jgi:cytochrome c oxidase subunit 4